MCGKAHYYYIPKKIVLRRAINIFLPSVSWSAKLSLAGRLQNTADELGNVQYEWGNKCEVIYISWYIEDTRIGQVVSDTSRRF